MFLEKTHLYLHNFVVESVQRSKMCSHLVGILVAVASVVTSSTAKYISNTDGGKMLSKGSPGFVYDCSGKEDGNYPHPTKCTHYVACVGKAYSYEMVCALNHDGFPLHYVADSGPDPVKSRCDYPELAGCQSNLTSTGIGGAGSQVGSGTQLTTRAPTQVTTKSPTQSATPASLPGAGGGGSSQVTTRAPSQGPSQGSAGGPAQGSVGGTSQGSGGRPIQGSVGGSTPGSSSGPSQGPGSGPSQGPGSGQSQGSAGGPAQFTTKPPIQVTTTKASWQVTTKSPSSSTSNSLGKPSATFDPNTNMDNCLHDEKCKLKGYCRKYFTFSKESNRWEEHTCGQDLFWNEKANNGSIHGGNCDFFLNVEPSVQEKYRNDPKCIPPCEWWQTDEEQCTGRYNYRIPFNNVTLLGRETTLQCPQSGGVTLVWVQSSLSCERCSDATDSRGNACRGC